MRTKLFIGSSPPSTMVRGLDWLSQTRDSVQGFPRGQKARKKNPSSRRRISPTGRGWLWGYKSHKGLEVLWDYGQLQREDKERGQEGAQ